MLQGFYSHQSGLRKHLSQYFLDECAVELIPFSMDYKGYDALADVLNNWESSINPEPLLPLDRRIEAQRWLDE